MIVIRLAREADLPTLLGFEQSLIQAERPFDPTFRDSKFHYYDLLELIKGLDTDVFVAEDEGKVIGSGHVRTYEGKNYNVFEKYAFLGFMYVLPEYRGKGVNQLVIDKIKEWAKERNLVELRLQVYDENISAVKAYEKVGFKKILTEMRTRIEK